MTQSPPIRPADPPRLLERIRPGARTVLLTLALGLVLGSAVVTAASVADHLTLAVTDEAVRSAESVVRGYVDPILSADAMHDPSGAVGAEINRELERLVASGGMLRIKIWGPDGTILFSDLAALRGARFPISEELEESLEGENATEVSAAAKDENVFERGLADRFLEIYLPIRDPSSGEVVAAYEIYQDAAPILGQIDAARADVFTVAVSTAAAILVLMYIAFGGLSARLARTNRTLRQLAGEVRRSEARFRSLVQNSGDVVAVLDPGGKVTYQSEAIRQVLGYDPDDRMGTSLFELVHPEDTPWARRIFAEVVARPASQREGETRIRHADGSWRVMEWTLTNVLDDPAVDGVVLNARDVSARKSLEDQLTHQALHDPMTGLPNRALFMDRVEHALSRRDRRQKGVAVLFIDLDDFKAVNDSLGYATGDQVLAGVAERLRGVLRPADTVARLAGDEFAILLDEPIAADAPEVVAERILAALREPIAIERGPVLVQASVGIARSDGLDETPSDLLRDADIAMYSAKRRGKGRHEVFEMAMRAPAVTRLELKADLERALAAEEFVLHYQPIVSLADGRINSVEALVRWAHPARGILAPQSFISFAEETGQIVPLGRWVLANACRQAARWHEELGTDVSVAVNLSARQLLDLDVVGDVKAALRDATLDPAKLIVEVTESAWVEQVEASAQTLQALRRLGVHLAIDDFGIGYSSLSYLQRYPFDSLKIDRSFVAALGSEGGGETLVRSIVELGRRLDRTVVAEGIERVEQLAVLRRLGCTLGQGRLFAVPVDSLLTEELLRVGAVELPRTSGRAQANGHGRAAGQGRAAGSHGRAASAHPRRTQRPAASAAIGRS